MISGKKILVCYITERSGHHAAALALKKGFAMAGEAHDVDCVNALRYLFPISERLIHRFYLFVIRRIPCIWRSIYDRPSLVKKSDSIKDWVHRRSFKKLKNLLDTYRPDAVVCTQAFPCGVFSAYKKARGGSFKIYGVLTDFAPHSFWVYPEVDGFFVAAERTKEDLVERGVRPEKIHITGIPIDPKFAKTPDSLEIRAAYGLVADVPVVLVMGGGHGLGPIKQVLSRLDLHPRPLQVIVICGLNRRLYAWLVKRAFRKRTLLFKYTDEIDRLMSVATLIISKPGGITSAEALTKNLPMIVLNPIPGQESRNTRFLVDQHTAISAESVEGVVAALERILTLQPVPTEDIGTPRIPRGFTDPSFRKAQIHLMRPNSSVDIARTILKGL